MKHLLPLLENLLHTDFVVLSDTDLKIECEATYVFKQEQNTVWKLSKHKYLHHHENIYDWKKAAVLKIDAAIQEVVQQLQASDVVVITNEEETIIGYLDSLTLLTKLFESYQYLHAYFQTMIDTMYGSVSIVDEAGKTVVWTPGAERIFSIPKEEIIGNEMEQFFPKEMLLNKVTMETGQSFRPVTLNPNF